jgi:uncharacterized membrane protein
MNTRQSLLAQAVLLVGNGLYSLVVGRNLPDRVPTHWGLNGKPDAWGSPVFGLWFGPAIVGFLMLLTWVLPKISPRQFDIQRFSRTYGALMFILSLMMTAMHVLILHASAHETVDIGRAILIVLGLFFALFGNMMGKVRRNFYMGVRTPWTLASERVWDTTHRHAGVLWFFGGLVIAFLALLGVPQYVGLPLILILAFWPIVDSYLLYRRLENR